MKCIVDTENGGVVGPFADEDDATAYTIACANVEGWVEVIEAGDFPFENTGLVLEDITLPEVKVPAKVEALRKEGVEEIFATMTSFPGTDWVRILGNIVRVEAETLADQVRTGFVPEEVYGEDMTMERYEAALKVLQGMFKEI